MPRGPRLDVPGVLQHVMARGIERRRVVRDDQDRATFVRRLAAVVEHTGARCFAWALLPNHVHLLLTTGRSSLGTVMQRLLGWYAGYFNRRHRRAGHVFQNRYKSLICQDDPYLLELVRYIHLNPVGAGAVRTPAQLDRHRWSGHAVLMGRREAQWQATAPVLGLFNRRIDRARAAYRAFVLDRWDAPDEAPWDVAGRRPGVGRPPLDDDTARADVRVLGDPDFVGEVLAEAGAQAARRSRAARAGWTPPRVLAWAAQQAGIEPGAIRGASKKPANVLARGLACRWLLEDLGLRPVEVGRLLGVDASIVRRAAARVADRAKALPGRLPNAVRRITE